MPHICPKGEHAAQSPLINIFSMQPFAFSKMSLLLQIPVIHITSQPFLSESLNHFPFFVLFILLTTIEMISGGHLCWRVCCTDSTPDEQWLVISVMSFHHLHSISTVSFNINCNIHNLPFMITVATLHFFLRITLQ